jgi:hypothetical protein
MSSCKYYGDCPYNTMDCEVTNPHYHCKYRANKSMSERDKFLTEQMGECWHKPEDKPHFARCIYCDSVTYENTSFSTPDGFFKLWNWAQKQGWYKSLKRFVLEKRSDMASYQIIPDHLIHPDRFADAAYKYLKERDNEHD